MQLHEDKFDLIVHKANNSSVLGHLPFTVESYTYTVSSGDILYPVDQLKYLGVIVSRDLSWSPHINTISSGARSIACWVLTFKCLQKQRQGYHANIQHCISPLWEATYNTAVHSGILVNCKIADIQELESVQRTFTAQISGFSSLNYWERLKSLKLTSLQRRRERYILLDSTIVENSPPYLFKWFPNKIHGYFKARHLRASFSNIPGN